MEKDLLENKSKADLEVKMMNLLEVTFSLCVFSEFDPEAILSKSNCRFEKRFKRVKELLKEDGLINLKGQPLEFVEKYRKRVLEEEKEN
jgi:ATP diphosphatase